MKFRVYDSFVVFYAMPEGGGMGWDAPELPGFNRAAKARTLFGFRGGT